MPPGFQVQCCANGKSKNYVSFTYSYPSGIGGRGWVKDWTRCLNYDQAVIFPNWSYHSASSLSLYYRLSSSPSALFAILISSHPSFLLFYSLFNVNISSPPQTQTCVSSAAFFSPTWPQFVNILPLAHPLCWYNDHLTVKSKARRKLGRRRQRGQQHWSNYVSFSPSILTLMKSLIVRGKRKVGRRGQVHEMYVVHLSYSLKWTEGAARIM